MAESEAMNPNKLLDFTEENGCDLLEIAFQGMFTLNERMYYNELGDDKLNEMQKEDPYFSSRYSIYGLSKMVGHPCTRAVIQPTPATEALVVDLIPGVPVKKHPGSGLPMILVRVSHHLKDSDSLRNAKKLMHSTEWTHGVNSINAASLQEMEILRTEFESNANLLDRRYLKKLKSSLPNHLTTFEGSYTSFVKPIFTPKEPKKEEAGPCLVCGEKGKKFCSRCKVARYCSKDCQKADWKTHKKTCVSPEQLATEKHEQKNPLDKNAKLWIDIDPKKTPDWMKMMTGFSTNQSFSKLAKKASPELADIRVVKDELLQQKKDKMNILKVQIPMGASVFDNQPMAIYSKGKRYNVLAVPQNIIGGEAEYRRLFLKVQNDGDSARLGGPGLKAYMRGYITAGAILRVMVDEVLPVQPW